MCIRDRLRELHEVRLFRTSELQRNDLLSLRHFLQFSLIPDSGDVKDVINKCMQGSVRDWKILKIEATQVREIIVHKEKPVSYTHLDVYKRQAYRVVTVLYHRRYTKEEFHLAGVCGNTVLYVFPVR